MSHSSSEEEAKLDHESLSGVLPPFWPVTFISKDVTDDLLAVPELEHKI